MKGPEKKGVRVLTAKFSKLFKGAAPPRADAGKEESPAPEPARASAASQNDAIPF
jgi:hypothetical protein